MSLALDSYYTIGQSHRVCQDYGRHGWIPCPHVILSDGCSAEPDSDIGARLLVLNAHSLLPQFLACSDLNETEQTALHQQLGEQIVQRAAGQARDMGVDETVLDATLLVAWRDRTSVYVHLYGDGCILTKTIDGEVAVIQVEYAENAPYYLSYLLDRNRQMLYQEMMGDPAIAKTVNYRNEAGIRRQMERFDAPTMFRFEQAALQTLAVSTDGLMSFINADTFEYLDARDVAQVLLDFRSIDSDFVGSQIRTVLVEYGERSIICLDDLCMGVFCKES